jgi:hypothetical protein
MTDDASAWAEFPEDTPAPAAAATSATPATGQGGQPMDWSSFPEDKAGATPVSKSPVGEEIGKFLEKYHLAGPLEATTHMVTSAAAFPVAAAASLYHLATEPAGLKAQRAAEAVKNIQEGMTYQPRTQQGQSMADKTDTAISYLGPKEGDWLKDKALQYGANPYVAGGLDVAANAPLALLGARLGAGKTLGRTPTPEVTEATNAGIRLTPQQGGQGFTARAAAGTAGRAQLERELSRTNAETVDNLAKEDVGVPEDRPLNDATLDQAAAPHNALYDQVGKLGKITTDDQYRAEIAKVPDRTSTPDFQFDTPDIVNEKITNYGGVKEFDAANAVAKVRQLRRDANAALRGPYNPENQALGYANRAIADAIENQLERHVQNLSQPVNVPGPTGQAALPGAGAPFPGPVGGTSLPFSAVPADLLAQFKNARVQLAKINNVRDSLRGSHIDASTLRNMADRDVPLTGNLGIIARAKENFDRSLQHPNDIRDHEVSLGDVGLGIAGAAAHPAGVAAMLARPAIRAGINTSLYQKYGIARPPQLPAVVPGAGAGAALDQQQPTSSDYL